MPQRRRRPAKSGAERTRSAEATGAGTELAKFGAVKLGRDGIIRPFSVDSGRDQWFRSRNERKIIVQFSFTAVFPPVPAEQYNRDEQALKSKAIHAALHTHALAL